MRPATTPTAAGLPRRSVLLTGVGAGAVLLGGCTLNNPFSTAKTPAARAVRDLAPDVGVAVQAVVEIRTQAEAVADSASRFPAIAARLSGLRALHQAHVDALVAAVPKRVDTSITGATAEPPTDARHALLGVLAGEASLRDRLDGLALTAESGQFARLLGSMAAGISQYSTRLQHLAGIHSPFPGPKLPPLRHGPEAAPALQQALAAEHAAVAVYAYLGAQASQSRQPALYDSLETTYRAHRGRRDELTVLISGDGAVPTPAAVGYQLPTKVANAREMTDAALLVERRITSTYGQLVESTADAMRRWALVALDEAAVRQLEFRGTPEMFPGSTSRS
jgi:hypothetical protein